MKRSVIYELEYRKKFDYNEDDCGWRVEGVGWVVWNGCYLPVLYYRHRKMFLIYRSFLTDWLTLILVDSPDQNSISFKREPIPASVFVPIKRPEFNKQSSDRKRIVYIGRYGERLILGSMTGKFPSFDLKDYLYFIKEGIEGAFFFVLDQSVVVGPWIDQILDFCKKWGISLELSSDEKINQLFNNPLPSSHYLELVQAFIEEFPIFSDVFELDFSNSYWDPYQFSNSKTKLPLTVVPTPDMIIGQIAYMRGTLCVIRYGESYYIINWEEILGRLVVNLEEGFW